MKRRKSFTLIEVLVAMAILGIILVIFYSTWFLGIKATRRSHEIAQKYMGARVFLNFLGKELRSSFEFDWPGKENFVWDPGKKKLEFWGTAPDEIKVIYPHPFPIHRNIYYVKEKDGEKVLYKRVEPFFSQDYPGQYKILEGPVLEGDFDFNIEPIYTHGKIPQTLPDKLIISLTIKGVQKLQKVIYINELKKTY
jgi:prepilin-type N-terminal cleavage/methylation domain-containing protein